MKNGDKARRILVKVIAVELYKIEKEEKDG